MRLKLGGDGMKRCDGGNRSEMNISQRDDINLAVPEDEFDVYKQYDY